MKLWHAVVQTFHYWLLIYCFAFASYRDVIPDVIIKFNNRGDDLTSLHIRTRKLHTFHAICSAMSASSAVNVAAGDLSSERHSALPQPVTVLEAADIPKVSPEALCLLKSFGKHTSIHNTAYY